MRAANQAVLPSAAGQVRLENRPLARPPGGAELVVRMLYAPINPADILAIDGRYSFSLDPDVPIGAEGVGIVEQVGPGVTDLFPGDQVILLSRGNWCRYRLVPRSDVVALPAGIDAVQAAMLRINPATAQLLIDAAHLCDRDVIVQNAATSAVAQWVRAVAARRAIRVIDVVRRPDEALPDAIVDGPDLPDRVMAAAAGLPIRAALDCVAGTASERLARCLPPGGRLIVFGHLSGEPLTISSQVMTRGALIVQGFSLRPAEAAMAVEDRAKMYSMLFELSVKLQVRLPVRSLIPLSRFGDAIAMARTPGRGRVMFDLTG